MKKARSPQTIRESVQAYAVQELLPVSSLRFRTNSRSINATTAIPPPNPMLPILKKAASRRSREMRSVSGVVWKRMAAGSFLGCEHRVGCAHHGFYGGAWISVLWIRHAFTAAGRLPDVAGRGGNDDLDPKLSEPRGSVALSAPTFTSRSPWARDLAFRY